MQKSRFLVLTAILLAAPAMAFDPPVATDINPAADIVEVNLSADVTTWQFISGIETDVYAYNGTIPGPTIEANIGDTVIVNFTNNLPEATTVHWHGVDTPATMDGSHVSQPHIQPGGTFRYEFVVDRASLFWYHPHVRTFDQVEKGLYGGLLVRDPAKDAALGFDQLEEHIVFFDDILLDNSFQIVPAFSFADPLQNALYHVNGREGNHLLVNGREASEVLLQVPNGKPQRWRFVNAANTTFARLGFGAVCRPGLPWPACPLWWIGTDGGLLEERIERRSIVPFSCGLCGPEPNDDFFSEFSTDAFHGTAELTGEGRIPGPLHPTVELLAKSLEGMFLLPGERADMVFHPIGDENQIWTIWQHDWLRGRHIAVQDPQGNILLPDDPLDGIYPQQEFMRLQVVGPNPGVSEWEPPQDLQTTIVTPGPSKGVLPVTFGHGLPDTAGNVTLFAQADFSTGTMVPLPAAKVDSFNAFDVEVDDVWTWEVKNLTHGDHPFHTHGFTFVHVDTTFMDMDDPSQNITFEWPFQMIKDTIRAPARGGLKGRSFTITRLATHFDDTNREGQAVAMGELPTFDGEGNFTSGGWLFHCHVLEHSAKGMLSFFEVRDPSNPFILLGKSLAGANGAPSLTAEGDLSPGSRIDFTLVNAAPNAPVQLIASIEAQRQMIAGGEFVPAFSRRFFRTTDSEGRATFSIKAWNKLPPGREVYWQVAVKDATGPEGWAFSNALMFVKP